MFLGADWLFRVSRHGKQTVRPKSVRPLLFRGNPVCMLQMERNSTKAIRRTTNSCLGHSRTAALSSSGRQRAVEARCRRPLGYECPFLVKKKGSSCVIPHTHPVNIPQKHSLIFVLFPITSFLLRNQPPRYWVYFLSRVAEIIRCVIHWHALIIDTRSLNHSNFLSLFLKSSSYCL